MERPMTTEELYNKICGILKEKGKIPDILDYGLPTHNPVSTTTYEFDFKNNLDYGSSEEIYLDLWMEYFINGERRVSGIGTFKTLRTDHDAMHIMAGLLADFMIEGSAYVNTNLDDFTWKGADVPPIDGSGKRYGWGYENCVRESGCWRGTAETGGEGSLPCPEYRRTKDAYHGTDTDFAGSKQGNADSYADPVQCIDGTAQAGDKRIKIFGCGLYLLFQLWKAEEQGFLLEAL